jgi:hypothetical protein
VLAGDRSVAQLSRLIAKTMPEDEPGTCVGEDAEKVAGYIYDNFYSKAAQAKNKPPRIELSRLTVRQYRNAVADLVGSFIGPDVWVAKRGLRAEYFKSRRFDDSDLLIQRVDREVRFDFGETGPEPEKFDADKFSIRWGGSVFAPETGEYEFIVRTEHAARLWINDTKSRLPLIDAWVKSGNDTEYRGSVYLLGGRVYPLRLEFAKGTQGEPDGKKEKKKPPPEKASIALAWKQPHRAEEVIPERHLMPGRPPEVFVIQTAFPPDDRSIGYERGSSISKAWDQSTTEAAIDVAGYVMPRLRGLSGVGESASDRGERLQEFCLQFAERAFRRPLSEEQKELYVRRRFAESSDLNTAVKRSMLLILKSPRFLYREVGGGQDSYDVASRLSFNLWDSLPDQSLLNAAASGQLTTREQVISQAERMLLDARAHSKLREFFLQWLRVDQVPDLAKDQKKYPEFGAAIASDLRTSLDLFLDDVIWGEASDFRQLLLADFVYLNGRLSQLYGGDLAPDAPFQKVTINPDARAGLLSHPYLMSTFAYTSTSSPIHRGVFLSRSVLGRGLRPPPEAVAPLAPELHADLTTRQRVSLQTSAAACTTCHGMINPLGFGLEQFDAIGRYRTEENGKPIDASGAYETPQGDLAKFTGAKALGTLLADSEETQTAFIEQLFHFLVKQPIRAYGPRVSATLRSSFVEKKFHIRKLVVDMMALSALPPEPKKTASPGPKAE